MKRSALCALLVALLAAPAVAVGPLAFLAKEMVKSIVRQFVENRMNQMLATAGPCGMPIGQPGAMAGLAGMLHGRGGMPAMPSMSGGVPALPGNAGLPGAAGALTGAAGGASMGPPATMRGRPDTSTMVGATPEQIAAIEAGGMPPLADMKLPPGMAEKMQEHMARQAAKNPAGLGDTGRTANSADMARAMAAMQDRTPLTADEADELGTLMERMAAAMPSAAPRCAPGEMKAMLQTAADSPMGGGVLRMMLGSMREMQKRLDEARETFEKMSPAERSEYVETMTAEFRGWDKPNRQALLGMVETNFFGMPEDMKTQLLARLTQEK